MTTGPRLAMKILLAWAVACIVTFTRGQELSLAEPCDPEECLPPDCRCSSTDIPGGLLPRDTPQFVLLTFDDGVNIINIEFYRRLLYNLRNKNGCPAEVTLFVQHEYTNYELVNELYNQGFEIGLNSMTHQTPQTYWAQADYDTMVQEIGDQRLQLAHFANIPYHSIAGVRLPFMQMGGNASFQVMAEVGLTYDATWSTFSFVNPGLWPYTLDYASNQDCNIPPCPSASIPGTWVLPLVSWIDANNFPCVIVESCFGVPAYTDEEGWFTFFVSNFERHYMGNRAPFSFNTHEWFLATYPAVQRAFIRFFALLNQLEDVYMVKASKVIEWVKDPVPLGEYNDSPIGQCSETVPQACLSNSCGPLLSEHNGLEYYMGVCVSCPSRYPWLGNPLGM